MSIREEGRKVYYDVPRSSTQVKKKDVCVSRYNSVFHRSRLGWALRLGPDRFADRLPLLTCSMCFKEVKMDSKEGWDNRSDIFRIVWY